MLLFLNEWVLYSCHFDESIFSLTNLYGTVQVQLAHLKQLEGLTTLPLKQDPAVGYDTYWLTKWYCQKPISTIIDYFLSLVEFWTLKGFEFQVHRPIHYE